MLHEAITAAKRRKGSRWEWKNLRRFSENDRHFSKLMPSGFAPWQTQFQSCPINLSLHPDDGISRDFFCFEVWIGDEVSELFLETPLLEAMIDRLLPETVLTDLSASAVSILLEYILIQETNSEDPTLPEDIMVSDAYRAVTACPEGALMLSCTGLTPGPKQLAILAPNDLIQETANRLVTVEKPRTTSVTIPVIASCRCAPLLVSSEDLYALKPKDGFLLPVGWQANQVQELIIADAFSLSVMSEIDGIWVAGELQSISEKKELEMSKVERIEVEVSIEVAREHFPLEEIANLREGDLLTSSVNVGSIVTLFARDQKIATGELIEVDGRFGIIIQTLA